MRRGAGGGASTRLGVHWTPGRASNTTRHQEDGGHGPVAGESATVTTTSNPIVVQGDRTLLLEVDHPFYAEARDALAQFAELEKSPEHIHTYRLTPLSLWNAAAAGLSAAAVIASLARYSRYDIPPNILADIRDYIGRYGRLKLLRDGPDLILRSDDVALIAEVARHKRTEPYVIERRDEHTLVIDAARRGHVKQALIAIGFPAEDLAGYTDGAALPVTLRDITTSGEPFQLRQYQRDAVRAFYADGGPSGGSGVVVLPCGAGKTIVGIGAMAAHWPLDADPLAQHHRRAPVDERAARQDDADRRPGRRIHRRAQRDPTRHRHHLPDPDLPRQRRTASSRTSACSTATTGA